MTTDVLTQPRKHVDRLLCYVAGPYAHPDPVENTHRAFAAAERLEATNLIAAFVPHMTLAWHLVNPHDADFWYDLDIAYLDRMDCLLRIPGQSVGADKEVEYAYANDIMVFFDEESLLWWAAQQIDE